MKKLFKSNYLLIIALGACQLSSLAFGSTKVADELIEFNSINEVSSINCPVSTQYAIIRHPLYATFIVSEDPENTSGFADLLLSDENFSSSDSTPQVTLYNEGIQNHLDLIGAGPTDSNGNYQVGVSFGGKVLYLNRTATDDVTPLTGNNGFSELDLSLSPASSSQARCVVNGQIVQSMPFSN